MTYTEILITPRNKYIAKMDLENYAISNMAAKVKIYYYNEAKNEKNLILGESFIFHSVKEAENYFHHVCGSPEEFILKNIKK